MRIFDLQYSIILNFRNLYRFLTIIVFIVSCKNTNSNTTTLSSKKKEIQFPECENVRISKEGISNDTIFLKDKGFLFWNYDCDSTWLTYISKSKNRFILETWIDSLGSGYSGFDPRLSKSLLKEFYNSILFQSPVISGCCELPDNILFDKESGIQIENFGPKVWLSDTDRFPILITFNKSEDFNNDKNYEFEKLNVYNINLNKKYIFPLKKYSFFKNLKLINSKRNTELVEFCELNDNILKIHFQKETSINSKKYKKFRLELNLNKYIL